jgi:hypothetical protein
MRYLSFLSVLVLVGLNASGGLRQGGSASNRGDSIADIAGVWRGNSKCVDKDSPCRDEVNVYRFTAVPGHSSEFSGNGSKVVDGKEVAMGSVTWHYDSETAELHSQSPAIRLVVHGEVMEGDLFLSDGQRYRHILLKKDH